MAKFKYLIFRETPYNRGETVAQIDVSHLNKRGVEARWSELEKIFPRDKYQSSLTTVDSEYREFINEPNDEKAEKTGLRITLRVYWELLNLKKMYPS